MKKLLKFLFVVLLIACAYYVVKNNGMIMNQPIVQDIVQNVLRTPIGNRDIQPPNTSVAQAGAGMYAYETLQDEEKLVYNQLLDGIKNMQEKITISTKDENIMKHAYDAMTSEHAELFWIEGYRYSTYEVAGINSNYVVEPIYLYSKDEVTKRQQKIDEYTSQCLQGLPSQATDYRKVKYVYEYIVNNTSYNELAEENQNICSVMIYKESVCKGYASALQYLLNKEGIYSMIVSGTANGEAHAWNLVVMDGAYYYVDATWGEPSVSELTSDIKENINYAYLGITTEELNKTHQSDDSIELPICNAIENNYYVREGKYLQQFDKQSVYNMIVQAQSNNTSISIKCADEVSYEQLRRYLLEQSNAYKIMKVNAISYYDDENNHILTLYPQ